MSASFIQETNFATLPAVGEANIDRLSTLPELIAEEKRLEKIEAGHFYHQGYILGLMFNQFAIDSKEYDKSKSDFSRFLFDNGMTININLAWQKMKIFATFSKFSERTREQIKALGVSSAYIICDYVSLQNVDEIISVARSTRSDKLSSALSNFEKVGGRVTTTQSNAKFSMREKELKRQRQQYYGMMDILGKNYEGELLGETIFIPRNRALSEADETQFKLVYNAARGNKSMDQFFRELMSHVMKTLPIEKQNEIEDTIKSMFENNHQAYLIA